jgi:hypothetical protein
MGRAGAVALVAGLAAAAPAAAQTSDPVAAEALFDQGRRLMDAGRYAEACPKLEASQKLDPGVGTLLNLGDCLERLGRTASAWERFREAAAAAVAAFEPEREGIARQRAAAIEPRLCRVEVLVAEDADIQGLALERDHAPFERALWNEPLPIDPGDHVVVATAPGKEPWSRMTHVESSTCAGQTDTITVPRLVPGGLGASPNVPGPLPVLRPPPIHRPMTRWGLQQEVALVCAGVGVLLLGTGAALAIDASISYSHAKDQCLSGGCPGPAQQSALDAGRVADFATAALVAGGVTLLGSGILWFTAKKHAPLTITPMALGGGASLTLRGELY